MTRVADVVDWLYCSLQFCLPDAAHALKVVSKGWLGTVAAVRAGALKEARTFGFGGVICGHTHYREDLTVDGVRYINTGCWMGKETTWIEIIDGELTCHHVEAK
jgi:UDP-2,3-diacylglucosamine pyrophosphatase LpxH